MRPTVKVLLLGVGMLAILGSLPGDEPRRKDQVPPKSTVAWTLEEALEQLQLYPRDSYLQYVVMQLARREGRHEEIAGKLGEELFGVGRGEGRSQVDLFSLFAGTLALQESLQLEAMRDPDSGAPRRGAATPAFGRRRWGGPPVLVAPEQRVPLMIEGAVVAEVGTLSHAPLAGFAGALPLQGLILRSQWAGPSGLETDFMTFLVEHHQLKKDQLARKILVRLAELKGPEIKSHPWKKMLGGKKPVVSQFSRSVPDDFYLAEFRSLGRMLDFLRTSEQWGAYLYQQGNQDARTSGLRQRYLQQLALQTNELLRPFYDLVVAETAVTGSDLFFTEGTDVTLLFRCKQPEAFKAQMARLLNDSRKTRPDAKLSKGEVMGVAFDHLATPDRQVCVYASYPAPDIHVRSNSLVALGRVIAAIKGQDKSGKAVQRLGETEEYQYVHSLFSRAAGEEDGFIYLSDPFIRHMVGPRLKLTERRRLVSYNHLRMISHGAQLYRTEMGRPAESLAALIDAGCCPGKFNHGELRCPFGGTYSLAADGLSGACTACGSALFLTPCCETQLEKVSKLEADEYQDFVKEYSEFWKTFFDPIALRIQVTPKRYKVETVILPLIDNSIYTGLAKVFGGKPEPLDGLPVPKRVLFSLGARLNKEALLQEVKPLIGLVGDLSELDKAVALHLGAFFTGSLQMGFPESLPCAALAPAEETTLGLYDPAKIQQWQLLALAGAVEKFLAKGIGNQVGVHIYDVPLTFDAGLEALFGEGVAQAAGRGNADSPMIIEMGAQVAIIAPWFFAPMYVSLPVQDATVVDQFLTDLDRQLIPLARKRIDPSIPVALDYYRITTAGGVRARSACLRIGPLRVRAFWARLGNAVYIANQPSVLNDIQGTTVARRRDKGKTPDRGPTAHVMVRLRPCNWEQALEGFRLTWAENCREACLHNLGPLSSAGRAYSTARPLENREQGLSWDARSAEAIRYAEKLHGLHFTCPERGRYVLSKNGKTITCTAHGSAKDPRQQEAPAKDSPLARLMDNFKDLTASLTFRDDGLHAVLVIERK
jgi:hypothetical protein